MPTKEEEALHIALREGRPAHELEKALDGVTRPRWPESLDPGFLRHRLEHASTVVMTCGNPALMADVRHIAHARSMRFENEEW
jgi:hypothetical protein